MSDGTTDAGEIKTDVSGISKDSMLAKAAAGKEPGAEAGTPPETKGSGDGGNPPKEGDSGDEGLKAKIAALEADKLGLQRKLMGAKAEKGKAKGADGDATVESLTKLLNDANATIEAQLEAKKETIKENAILKHIQFRDEASKQFVLQNVKSMDSIYIDDNGVVNEFSVNEPLNEIKENYSHFINSDKLKMKTGVGKGKVDGSSNGERAKYKNMKEMRMAAQSGELLKNYE